ncbi:MAG: DUF309 domain-containing protein [Cyanobacteria bacterium K_DeepCast_35m_m2_155]|nr:DUF309 domain-containing protein [Cyanobacteria bacterium K_DeepCast_35m_m2_155]
MTAAPGPDAEQQLANDPRWLAAVDLFNAGQWYSAHDALEELWHESCAALRLMLQGILQIAVSQLHRERGNQRGAVILMGEGLGRLNRCSDVAAGYDLKTLRYAASRHLAALQAQTDTTACAAAQDGPLPPLLLQRCSII